jgi:predicted DNA-binding transcriptional regulator YafY
MSRSERLFSLLQALRRFRRPVSGKALAQEQELGVSMRTLCRDGATLQAQGADIAGSIHPAPLDQANSIRNAAITRSAASA